MTDATTTTQASTPAPKESEREIAFENLISGRLALQVLRNQLDTQIAGLHAQLAIAEEHMRRTEDLLRRAEEKLARQHPEVYASMMIEVESAPRRSRR